MANTYTYNQTVKNPYQKKMRRFVFVLAGLLLIAGIIAVAIYILTRQEDSAPAISKVETTEITGNLFTTKSPYFEFQDYGKWVADKGHTTKDTFVYEKFNKLDVQSVLFVYVNHVPPPLRLATTRVLPVRVVNDNTFDVTQLSYPCKREFGKNDLHNYKVVSINEAKMLCDPDSPAFTAQISEINGDYRLHLKRPNGQPIQFVITYTDTTPDPKVKTLGQIADSFKTL